MAPTGSEARSVPTFSVVMPAYNAAATIGRAIESVLTQTDGDFELLVVDDASRDATPVVVAEYAARDARVRPLAMPRNAGVAGARNVGLRGARGRFIAFLDADDYWLPTKLARQRQIFATGAEVVFAAYYRETPAGRRLVPTRGHVDFRRLLRGNCIGNLTGAYDRTRIGIVPQQSIGHEDYLMWLEVVRKSRGAVGIDEPLAVYTEGNASLSSNLARSAGWTWNIYRRYLKLSPLVSAACFVAYLAGAVGKRVGRRS